MRGQSPAWIKLWELLQEYEGLMKANAKGQYLRRVEWEMIKAERALEKERGEVIEP
jgi:hypothetical protein